MRLATVQQSRAIDQLSQSSYDLTGEVLMEAAGSLACREIAQSFYPEISRGTVAVVCGPGNNGGDGLVVARHLHSSGHRDLVVFLMAPVNKHSELFRTQLKRVESQGIRCVDMTQISVSKPQARVDTLENCTLVIDALFGIGLSKPVEAPWSALIDRINAMRVPVVSLDCPTGLQCDRGVVEGTAIRAHMTLTFGLAKPGFFVSDGPRHVGKLKVLPIGFPHEGLRKVATTHFLFNDKFARRCLPKRKDQSNKSNYGHVLLIAGQPGMWGAGVLSASSAYRIGAGYVTWMTDGLAQDHLSSTPEIITTSLSDDSIFENKKINAVAIGPGLWDRKRIVEIIQRLKKMKMQNVVLDAEAIRVCVEEKLFPLPPTWVLTPHAGELSEITGQSPADIETHRFESALEAARLTGCHVLLKGYRSVLAYQDRCLVIQAGNAALAKAGTGDVLTGMIAGLMAQNLDTVPATATAAFIHGKMADDWLRRGNDKRSLSASDIRDELPSLLSRLAAGAL